MHDLLLKQSCILCASYQGDHVGICKGCLQDLPWHSSPQCPQCAMLSNGLLCGNCVNSTPYYDATRALFRYAYPLDKLLQHYKYRESLHLANTFASLWLQKFSLQPAHVDLIIPMPMHPTRLKHRGFNQALEIAKLISHRSKIALDYRACYRHKLTPPQATLALKDRVKNMRGVFGCEKNLQGQRIALVDDVMTTGASLNELAKTLKKAGASHVECWVMARTLPQ